MGKWSLGWILGSTYSPTPDRLVQCETCATVNGSPGPLSQMRALILTSQGSVPQLPTAQDHWEPYTDQVRFLGSLVSV